VWTHDWDFPECCSSPSRGWATTLKAVFGPRLWSPPSSGLRGYVDDHWGSATRLDPCSSGFLDAPNCRPHESFSAKGRPLLTDPFFFEERYSHLIRYHYDQDLGPIQEVRAARKQERNCSVFGDLPSPGSAARSADLYPRCQKGTHRPSGIER